MLKRIEKKSLETMSNITAMVACALSLIGSILYILGAMQYEKQKTIGVVEHHYEIVAILIIALGIAVFVVGIVSIIKKESVARSVVQLCLISAVMILEIIMASILFGGSLSKYRYFPYVISVFVAVALILKIIFVASYKYCRKNSIKRSDEKQ